MPVELRCDCAKARIHARFILAQARQLTQLTALHNGELSIVLMDDRAIRRLNRRFRRHDKATDVLSFPQLDASESNGGRQRGRHTAPMLLGDIAISVETAARQASRLKISTAARLRTLLVHGFLHLLGYDHERSRKEAERMFKKERTLAKQLISHRPQSAERQ